MEKRIRKEQHMEEKRIMTIEKAKSLSSEEFALLDEKYGGFNNETYNNHQTQDEKETIYDFIKKGGRKIAGIRLLKNTD